jgi:hypothetical protein
LLDYRTTDGIPSKKKLMRRERFAINLTFFVVTFLTWTVPGTAQEGNKFSIPLKINEDLEQFSGQVIASGRNGRKLTYSIPAGKGMGQDDVSIIAVNVDEESHLPMARQIIRDYRLPWPHVMTGRGEADSVWKMFGAIGGNRLGIPLYVLGRC